MPRQKSSSRSAPKRDKPPQTGTPPQSQAAGFDIRRELDRLEEIILHSPRVPLTRWTLVEEEKLLDQLDVVRLRLPDAIEKALEVIRQKEDILLQAEDYAQDIIETAQKNAAQILDEMGIVKRAELEASQIRQQVQQEYEAIQQKTIAEIEQMRRSAQQEMQQLHQMTLAECEQIQNGADDYADAVLNRIEQQLSQMLRVIRNGRKQLNTNSPSQSSPNTKSPPHS
ncbi:MAG: ATP synthase F0 subunit B [Xenococcaceae cyanobacterium]